MDAIPSGTQTGQAVLEPVPEMADLFDDAGADGVIVLVTRAAETQHRVLAAFSAARMSALADALTQQQGSNELPNDADDLGYVVFDGATPDPETLAAVKAAAQGSNLMTPSRFFVVSRGDDVVPAHEAQCKQIITALGLTGTVLKLAAPLAGNEDVFGDAEAVTIAASRDKQTVLK